MKRLFIVAASLLVCCAQPKEEYFTKSVTFPEGATVEQKLDMASLANNRIVIYYRSNV